MNKQLSIINTNIDITKPTEFATLVAQADTLTKAVEAFWKEVNLQMVTKGIDKVTTQHGTIQFELAELLTIKDASVLDANLTKPALDTKKVRAYRELNGTFPAGVDSKVISKFVKRIKVAA